MVVVGGCNKAVPPKISKIMHGLWENTQNKGAIARSLPDAWRTGNARLLLIWLWEADMRTLKALLVLGLLSGFVGSVAIAELATQAYAQQCPNGVCP